MLTVVLAVVLAVVFATAVVLVDVAVPELLDVVVGALTKYGAALQLAIVNDEQSLASKFLMRPNSLWSIDRPHRAFTEIQSPKYVHQ